jgi:DHA2 family multidrug resistance protein
VKPEPTPPLHGFALVLLTLGLGLGTFMQVLDTSIANVSLPAISGDLAVTPNQGTWVITSFAVSNAISLALTGWLSRRFGQVRLFALSTLLFTLASWLCGMATTLPLLIAARVLQGAVAGPMIPLSQALLLGNYPSDKKGLALSFWSITVMVAPIMGPIMGGWITDNISWPWIFYINIPVGIFSSILTWRLLRKRESATARVPVDTVGLFLLVVGIGALQILLDKGNELDWFESRQVVVLTIISVVALAFLIVWELYEKHPVIDLHLFKNRNFLIGVATLSIGYLVFFGNVVILPLWLQTQMGYTATWAGMAAAPVGILSIFVTPLVGKNMHKLDLRIWASASFAVFAAVSFWNSSFNTDVTFWQLIAPRLVMGIGVSAFFVPLMSLTLSGIPPHLLASATGMSNFIRILGGSFGTSLSISLWDRRASFHHELLAERVTEFSPVAQDALTTLNTLGQPQSFGYAVLESNMQRQAVMLATNEIFWLSALMFVGLMLLVWFAKPEQKGLEGVAASE